MFLFFLFCFYWLCIWIFVFHHLFSCESWFWFLFFTLWFILPGLFHPPVYFKHLSKQQHDSLSRNNNKKNSKQNAKPSKKNTHLRWVQFFFFWSWIYSTLHDSLSFGSLMISFNIHCLRFLLKFACNFSLLLKPLIDILPLFFCI